MLDLKFSRMIYSLSYAIDEDPAKIYLSRIH